MVLDLALLGRTRAEPDLIRKARALHIGPALEPDFDYVYFAPPRRARAVRP